VAHIYIDEDGQLVLEGFDFSTEFVGGSYLYVDKRLNVVFSRDKLRCGIAFVDEATGVSTAMLSYNNIDPNDESLDGSIAAECDASAVTAEQEGRTLPNGRVTKTTTSGELARMNIKAKA
jgi:hypothetical protein